MIDPFGRTINYLRISVTDRCNLRCRYCMPEENTGWLKPAEVLSFEEIAAVARAGAALGITRVRLTGGEPLVRKNIETLVAILVKIEGIDDLAMTTNGTLLAEHAQPLAAAGLQRVNISLDAVDPQRYAQITRGGDVGRVLAGIAAARQAGLTPIKLNCVVARAPDEPDARQVARFAAAEGLQIRFIREMNLAAGRFTVVVGGSGGDCRRCNRLRLSSDGQIRPCLFSDLGFSVRQLGAEEALRRAVAVKPVAGSTCTNHAIHSIGG
jgi:GTP 3',8-cyclase